MKSTFFIAAILAVVCAKPVPNDAATVVEGVVLSGAGLIPYASAIMASSKSSNKFFTPIGFEPVSIATPDSVWGSEATQTVAVGFRRSADSSANPNGLQAKIALWKDINIFPDEEISAVNLDVSDAPPVKGSVDEFVRLFTCQTGDRLFEADRAYLRIETENVKPEIKVFSDRFTTIDNRLTSNMAGALFTIQCQWIRDDKNGVLPIRKESIQHSG